MKRGLRLSLAGVLLSAALLVPAARADLKDDLQNLVNQARDRLNQGVNEIRNLDSRLSQLGGMITDLGNQVANKGREVAALLRKIGEFTKDKLTEGVSAASDYAQRVQTVVSNALESFSGQVFDLIKGPATTELTKIVSSVADQVSKEADRADELGDTVSRLIVEKVEALADRAVAWALEQPASDVGSTALGLISAVPFVGEKIADAILNGYEQGLKLLRMAVSKAVLAIVPAVIGTLTSKLAGLARSAAAGVQKVFAGVGWTTDLMREALQKAAPLVSCITAGFNKEQGKYTDLIKRFVSSPLSAIQELATTAWRQLSGKMTIAWDTISGIAKTPLDLFKPPPTVGNKIDPATYRNIVHRQIPTAVASAFRDLALKIPDQAFEGMIKLVGDQFPLNCFVPYARTLYAANRSGVASVMNLVVDLVPEIWETVMGDKLPWLFGKVLGLLNEVIKYDTTIQNILSAVDKTFRNKLPRMTRMINEARKALTAKNPRSAVVARRLAEELRADVPFMNVSFWLEVVKTPLKEQLKFWAGRIIGDLLDTAGTIFPVVVGIVDTVLNYVFEAIPALHFLTGTVVKVITFIVRRVVDSIKSGLMSMLGRVVSWVVGNVVELAVNGVWGILNMGATGIDNALAGVRQKVNTQLPFNGPFAILVSGIYELYDRFIKPHLGTMQEHVTFISDLVKNLAADPSCVEAAPAAGGAPAAPRGGVR